MAQATGTSTGPVTDLVEELRLRRWARENYVSVQFRDHSWNACVLDEMQCRDEELTAADDYVCVAQRIVPLATGHSPVLRGPHRDIIIRPQVLARVPFVE